MFGDGEGSVADADSAGAFEDEVEFFRAEVFVERVGAEGREVPETSAEDFGAGAFEVIRVGDFHEVGFAPCEVVWGDDVESGDGGHGQGAVGMCEEGVTGIGR